MEGKYTLFKTSEGIFTVPILADNNIFTMKLDGQELSFRASIERYFIYYLYVYTNKGEVIGWLREIGKFNWNPNKFDRFIDEFIRLHPKEPFPEYSLDLVPMQADETQGLELPIPFYCPIITLKGEEELMQIIKEAPHSEIRPQMIAWFVSYCHDYGYSFAKKCKGAQYDWLYESFIEQHALSKLSPRPATPEEIENARNKRGKAKREGMIRLSITIVIYITVLALLGCLAFVWIDDSKYPLPWFLSVCTFLAALGMSTYIFKSK
jgi:hypothetical protein